MAALPSIDTAVFRFINETLANPFCDWLMPILAGGWWFMALLLVAAPVILWKGGPRARLLLLMLAIVLPIGDGWITNRLKHAIERPRPCRVVETVRLPMLRESLRADDDNELHRGCAGTGSMPSGHTTNWFAATMVVWIFYRRSLRFMLPMACLVAFSRIYNGVHYPSDVLVGAILGAGYGLALAWVVDRGWCFIASRWFPLWWKALPSLALAGPATPSTAPAIAQHEPETTNDHWLRLGYVLIAAAFIGRLFYLASGRIELSGDEAYQWLWSKHLALSYYSKPPLIAYVQWLGTHLVGDNELGVRFFSPVCAALGGLVALRFFARHVSARAGFWLVAIMNVTPLLGVGSTLMTVDPLLVLFWSLAMFTGWRAVQPEGRTLDWALVGLWMGLAFLSKYTALLQWLCWAVFFILWKPARIHLRKPGPYLALAINAVCTLPVLIWNAQHDWITVTHVATDAQAGQGWKLDWHAPLEFFGGTFGLLHPVFFIATAWACCALWKRREPLPRFFFAMGAPLYLVYAFYTLHSSGELNWIAASVIPLFCLMVLFWERRYVEGARHIRMALTVAMILGAAAVTLLHETDLVKKITGQYLPDKVDPLRRVRGWKDMARLVERERAKLEKEGRPVFVITPHYGTTGLLSFYMPEARAAVGTTPLVYYRTRPKPANQFYFWPGYPGTRQGQNALFVQEKDKATAPPKELVSQFASVTEIGNLPILSRGRVFHQVQVFACRDLLP